MMFAVQMPSGVMIYIPSFRHSEVDVWGGGSNSPSHRQHDDLTSLLLFYFFQNKERRLQICVCVCVCVCVSK
jgi:hypothetical protein